MHICSCNTQVLSGYYWTDWLEKCQQQKNVIIGTATFYNVYSF